MTSAFQVHTYSEAAPRFDAEVWDGTNPASLRALIERTIWSRLGQFTWATGDAGEFVATAPYLRVVIPAGAAFVAGPYWGGESWTDSAEGGNGECPFQVILGPVFATRFVLGS